MNIHKSALKIQVNVHKLNFVTTTCIVLLYVTMEITLINSSMIVTCNRLSRV